MIDIFFSIIQAFIFIVAVVTLFCLPGKFLLNKLNIQLKFSENLFLSTVLGVLIFTFVSYIFSLMQVGFMTFFVVIIIDFITIKNKWFLEGLDRKHLFPLLIVAIFSSIFSLSMVLNGQYGDNIKLTRDDLWHLALINELKVNFPPFNPGFAGVPLKGYHFFYNFLLAQVSNTFRLSPFSLHFHYFPILISLLWGTGVYILITGWTKSRIAALWGVFLTMFGGSFVYILHLQGYKNISLDSGFGMMQPASSLVNPPFAMSIPILIAALFAIYQYNLTRRKSWLVPLVFAAGLLSMFKVYAGIIIISGFLFLVLLELIKKNFFILIPSFIAGVLFFVTYWIFTDRNAYLIWYPFWAPHKVLLDNLPWYGYEEKQYTYSRLSVIKGLVEIELYAFFIFFIGNIGTRIFGLIVSLFIYIKKRKLPSVFSSVIFVMTLISILIPLLFIQTGKVFEITQMTWYFLFFCSIFAAAGFAKLSAAVPAYFLKFFLILIVVILTLPSAYEVYIGYLNNLKLRQSLSDPYFVSMKFLDEQGSYNNTVLEIPPVLILPEEQSLIKWYNASTPAITAFANKRSYFNNEYIDFPGTDKKPRINFLKKILLFNKMSPEDLEYKARQKEIEEGFKKNNIVFVYSPYSITNLLSIKNINQIFQNEAATIYKIEKE